MSVLRMVMVSLGVGLGLVACGGGGADECPGIVCSDCGASGDCNVSCDAPEVEYCGAFGYFDDPGLRCAFCESEDFEF